jgi:uroporphyrinogen-III synthase
MGMETILRPLFKTRAVEWSAPDAAMFDAVLMTSANAALHGGTGLAKYLNLPLYTVGDATAEAAKRAGFKNVISGDSDVTAIVGEMANDRRNHALHLAGRDRTAIGSTSFDFETITVYASEIVSAPAIPDDVVALIHSTRAALRFAAVTARKSSIAIIAISPVVADAAGSGWQSVEIARQPHDAAMLALAARLCEMREE